METTISFIILMYVYIIIFYTSKSNAFALPKFSSILVFGDSIVDSGNNNYIHTVGKANHVPYGRDFPGHVPTGRFSNGKIIPDLIASVLNIKDTVPPFLDRNLSNEQLLTGVNFASGGSGYDDRTVATIIGMAITMPKQIEHFKSYIEKLKGIAGEDKAQQIIADALVIVCAGSNDLFFNFYDFPATRRTMFDMDRYQDYLQDRAQMFIKDLYDLGCRKLSITSLAPLGCTPLEITLKLVPDRKCLEKENSDCELFNRKLARRLPQIQAMLPGSIIVYADVYSPMIDLINRPEKYGIKVTNVGCCGSGIYEVAPFCTKLTPVCDDASKYVFWDSVHPTEVAYRYITKYLEVQALPQFLLQ